MSPSSPYHTCRNAKLHGFTILSPISAQRVYKAVHVNVNVLKVWDKWEIWNQIINLLLDLTHTLKHSFSQDIAQKPMDEENDSLLGILRKELEKCPLNLTTLEKLQEECKVLDPRVSRLLSRAQLSHLLLKYEVPLQLLTVKLLFKRFSKANDQELVR